MRVRDKPPTESVCNAENIIESVFGTRGCPLCSLPGIRLLRHEGYAVVVVVVAVAWMLDLVRRCNSGRHTVVAHRDGERAMGSFSSRPSVVGW